MKAYNRLRQYVWLLDIISQKEKITLEEINKQWVKTEMSDGIEMTRHTFLRYKNTIADSFGIDIECDRRTNEYFICNPHSLRDNSIQRWMLSALTVSNIVSESLSLQDRILLENIPIEGKLLSLIIEAMKQKRRISFQYQKYKDDVPTERLIIPCCIKLFRQRWYVIEYNPLNPKVPFKAFAFDRISKPCITDIPLELPKDFNAEEIFRDSFGIFISNENKPQQIVIRAYGNEQKYIRDLPLHNSQEVIHEGEEYTDYKYFVSPTIDFINELLSRGNRIEVLKPGSLREKLRDEHLKAAKRYEKM